MSKIIKVKAKQVKDFYVNNTEAYEWWNQHCYYGYWKGDLILETRDVTKAKETFDRMQKALPHINMKLVRSFKDGYKIVFKDSTKDAIKDGRQLQYEDDIIVVKCDGEEAYRGLADYYDWYHDDDFYDCFKWTGSKYEYKDPKGRHWTLEVKDSKSTKDGVTHLETALKMEKDTIAKYKEFARIAGDGDNPETQLWNHLIEDEEEHVREIEAAMKGDYTHVNDAENDFQQSVDGVAKLLRKAKLQENVSFAEGDQTYKTVLVETPEDKFDKVLEALKEEYKIDSHNGKNRIFVKIKDSKENARNIEYIYEKPLEETTKKDEIVEEFVTQLFNTLADANIDANKYGIKEEDPYYYVEFLDEEDECKKAYEALCDSLFKCDLVIDKDDNYIKVLRR